MVSSTHNNILIHVTAKGAGGMLALTCTLTIQTFKSTHMTALVSKVSSNIVSFEKGEHKRPTFSCRFHCLISTSHKSKAPAPQPAIGALPSEHDDAACYCCGGGGGGVNGVPSRPKNKPILLYAPMAWIER